MTKCQELRADLAHLPAKYRLAYLLLESKMQRETEVASKQNTNTYLIK